MSRALKRVYASNLHITKKLEAVIAARNTELRACKTKISRLQKCFDCAMQILIVYAEWLKQNEQDDYDKAKARSIKRHAKRVRP